MRKHSVAYVEPRLDDLERWISRVHGDNLARPKCWSTFRMPTEAHAGCVGADLTYVAGITVTRVEGLLVKVAFAKERAHVIVGLLLGHGGRYAGSFRPSD